MLNDTIKIQKINDQNYPHYILFEEVNPYNKEFYPDNQIGDWVETSVEFEESIDRVKSFYQNILNYTIVEE